MTVFDDDDATARAAAMAHFDEWNATPPTTMGAGEWSSVQIYGDHRRVGHVLFHDRSDAEAFHWFVNEAVWPDSE